MSETIKAVAAMTALEIRERVRAIAATLGPKAHVSADVTASRHGWSEAVTVAAYPDDIGASSTAKHFNADTFEAALAAAEAWAATYAPIRREAAIRKLALDLIDLTDQHGNCTVAMLRGRGHGQDDIDTYRDAACARAGEMSGNAPFAIMEDV